MRISECGRTLLFEGQRLRRSEINAIQVLNHSANCLHELRDGPMMKA